MDPAARRRCWPLTPELTHPAVNYPGSGGSGPGHGLLHIGRTVRVRGHRRDLCMTCGWRGNVSGVSDTTVNGAGGKGSVPPEPYEVGVDEAGGQVGDAVRVVQAHAVQAVDRVFPG